MRRRENSQPAMPHQALLGWPRVKQRSLLQLRQARKHLLAVTAVDLRQPLPRDTQLQWTVIPVMDHQAVNDLPQPVDADWEIPQQRYKPAGTGDRALGRIPREIGRARHDVQLSPGDADRHQSHQNRRSSSKSASLAPRQKQVLARLADARPT